MSKSSDNRPSFRIGVDVGGTNTDAVVMKGRIVVASCKASTTRDVMTGVRTAIATVLERAGIEKDEVGIVVIGTTHFTNALVEKRNLASTAAIRLCLPAGACVPPMADWPDDMMSAVGNHAYLAKGGNELDGRAISPLDEDEIRRIAQDMIAKDISSVAITSIFSVVSPVMEQRAAEIIAGIIPGAKISCSSTIGRLGLLQRENATIFNASLMELADRTVNGFAEAVRQCGLRCPFYISQSDGTLLKADIVRQMPILTVSSGPTNSMRGAAFLTGYEDAIVIDIGGTTSDIGLLQKGFPREASTTVMIAGVRTNFRMPDVLSVGLGGGSYVRSTGDRVTVGPQSVGYEITSKGIAFGGDVLTATDIAVAAGLADVGDRSRVSGIDPALVARARTAMEYAVADAVDRVRISKAILPIIAVGGGSILLGEKIGDVDVLRPENFAVANAVGAAIAQASGEIDRVFTLSGSMDREAALREAESIASQNAIASGADENRITIVEREEIPVAYLPGNIRVRIKVSGEMSI